MNEKTNKHLTSDDGGSELLPGANLSRREFSKLVAAALGTLAVIRTETISLAQPGASTTSDVLMPSVQYRVGPCWPSELGDVRALISGPKGGGTVRVRIPWRRRDADPQNKEIIVRDAQTGKTVENVAAIEVNQEYGDLAFEPRNLSWAL